MLVEVFSPLLYLFAWNSMNSEERITIVALNILIFLFLALPLLVFLSLFFLSLEFSYIVSLLSSYSIFDMMLVIVFTGLSIIFLFVIARPRLSLKVASQLTALILYQARAKWRLLNVVGVLLVLGGLFNPWSYIYMGFGVKSQKTFLVRSSPFVMSITERWELGSIREDLNTARQWFYSNCTTLVGMIGLIGAALNLIGTASNRPVLGLAGGFFALASVFSYWPCFSHIPRTLEITLGWGVGLTFVGGLLMTAMSLVGYIKYIW